MKDSIFNGITDSVNILDARLGVGTVTPLFDLDVAGSLNTTYLYLAGSQITADATELNLLDGRSGILLDSLNVGNFAVNSITAGSGISVSNTGPGTTIIGAVAGGGITVSDGTIGIKLSDTETTTSTSSPSGLEITGSGLRMLAGCEGNQVLSWNSTTSTWECNYPTSLGGIISGSGAAGQIPFFTDTYRQSGSDNLFWDIANSRLGLGIGTSNPDYTLHVNGTGLIGTILLGDSGNTIGIETDSNLITLSNDLVNIEGNVNTTGYITAASAVNTINGLVINSGNITTGDGMAPK